MKKSLLIFLLFLFGIFLFPSNTFACNAKNTCQKILKTASSKVKSCCDKNDTKTKSSQKKSCKNDTDNGDCEGNCGNSKCGCVLFRTISSVSFFIKSVDYSNFLSSIKANFYYPIPSLSDGYSSLWLIPKIS